MKYWTVIINNKIPVLGNYINAFETKKACDNYIKNTFPADLRKLGSIKAGRIEVTEVV